MIHTLLSRSSNHEMTSSLDPIIDPRPTKLATHSCQMQHHNGALVWFVNPVQLIDPERAVSYSPRQ
jgi:hypothetical protein